MQEESKRYSPPIDKELELPETVFIRDIENKVFQGIVLQSLATIPGITLLEGNFIDTIFNRGSVEGIKGISTEQDNKSHSISVKIEVNINFGISIPEKAEEIQTTITQELTHLTGLHVSCVHVVFKNITPVNTTKKAITNEASSEEWQ
ncbi:MAG: Asp23/Gls24 family envelope stress response protein [Parachlamydiales bacterium]